jgi:hypothetical protein
MRRAFQHSGNWRRCTVEDRPGLIEGLIVSLGSPAKYCVSKARSAAATLGPIPTMPSSMLGPSSAIQRSLRKDSLGRRVADGLSGCALQ